MSKTEECPHCWARPDQKQPGKTEAQLARIRTCRTCGALLCGCSSGLAAPCMKICIGKYRIPGPLRWRDQ